MLYFANTNYDAVAKDNCCHVDLPDSYCVMFYSNTVINDGVGYTPPGPGGPGEST